MNAKEWAETVAKAREHYVYNASGDEETKWREQVAFVAGATFALVTAGVVDSVEICNEFAHRCGDYAL